MLRSRLIPLLCLMSGLGCSSTETASLGPKPAPQTDEPASAIECVGEDISGIATVNGVEVHFARGSMSGLENENFAIRTATNRSRAALTDALNTHANTELAKIQDGSNKSETPFMAEALGRFTEGVLECVNVEASCFVPPSSAYAVLTASTECVRGHLKSMRVAIEGHR